MLHISPAQTCSGGCDHADIVQCNRLEHPAHAQIVIIASSRPIVAKCNVVVRGGQKMQDNKLQDWKLTESNCRGWKMMETRMKES